MGQLPVLLELQRFAEFYLYSGTVFHAEVKLKSSVTDEQRAEQYSMVTLDSIYVSPFHRRRGAATKLLEHLAATHFDQDIAVSTPISSAMRKVLKKFLTERPTYRRKFWEVEGTGQEGDRKLIWYSLLKKERKNVAGDKRE